MPSSGLVYTQYAMDEGWYRPDSPHATRGRAWGWGTAGCSARRLDGRWNDAGVRLSCRVRRIRDRRCRTRARSSGTARTHFAMAGLTRNMGRHVPPRPHLPFGEVSSPTLFVVAGADRIVPTAPARALYESARGQKTWVEVPGGHVDAGHHQPGEQRRAPWYRRRAGRDRSGWVDREARDFGAKSGYYDRDGSDPPDLRRIEGALRSTGEGDPRHLGLGLHIVDKIIRAHRVDHSPVIDRARHDVPGPFA